MLVNIGTCLAQAIIVIYWKPKWCGFHSWFSDNSLNQYYAYRSFIAQDFPTLLKETYLHIYEICKSIPSIFSWVKHFQCDKFCSACLLCQVRNDLNGGLPTCLWYDSLYIKIIWLLVCLWNLWNLIWYLYLFMLNKFCLSLSLSDVGLQINLGSCE